MDTRQKIIQCALQELERSGLERFSIRATGAAAELSAMAVYRHFDDRDHLLRAVGEDAFAAFHRRVLGIKARSTKRWFEAVTRAYVNFALDEPGRFDACFVLRLQTHRIYPEDFRAGKSPVIALMAERLQSLPPSGCTSFDAVELALILWAQLHGLIMLHRAGRFSLSRRAFLSLCERATHRIVGGGDHNRTRSVKKRSP